VHIRSLLFNKKVFCPRDKCRVGGKDEGRKTRTERRRPSREGFEGEKPVVCSGGETSTGKYWAGKFRENKWTLGKALIHERK